MAPKGQSGGGEQLRRFMRQAAENAMLVFDASALINLSALINPQDVGPGCSHGNPTLLQMVREAGRCGINIVIPETVIFETTGHDIHSTQLTRVFTGDIEYPVLRSFFTDVDIGQVPNTYMRETAFGTRHMDRLRALKDDWSAFNEYWQENRHDVGDEEIYGTVVNGRHQGLVFVVTTDREFTGRLKGAQNRAGYPIGVIDEIQFVKDVMRVSPPEWLDPSVGVREIKEYMSHRLAHDDQRRAMRGRDKNRSILTSSTGRETIPPGMPSFGETLHIVKSLRNERGR